ncbi:protein AATF-like [Planococcus citri]|uniref:protein AATF-like n=1 Tax=Planococcus citri TaxID=170843 RepID=UPI0031F8942C
MTNRKKSIQKLVKENFSKKDNFDDDVHEEDNLVKRAVDDLLDENDVEEFPANDAFNNFSVFKSKSFPADGVLSSKTYRGKSVSRKSFEENSESEDDDDEDVSDVSESSEIETVSKKTKRVTFAEPSSENDESLSADDGDSEEIDGAEDEGDSEMSEVDEEDGESDSENDSDDGAEDESVEDESEVEDDISDNEAIDASFVYSKAVRDESSDKEKGEAVRVQLNLCESLLESRITLQKALFAANQLPKPSKYEEMWAEFSEDEKNTVIQCRESVWDLLENFIRLQCKFRQKCPEFLETLNESARKEFEEEVEDSEPKIKRRKLTEYPLVLDKLHNQYKPYRNAVIQKWNDRTKIASGKLAKTNFSAFDVPIVKQIEQIFEEKHRLIEKTCIKRADYKIIGNEEISDHNENSKSSSADHDEEIFDDDDFYHKLLRDYIERKTADVSDPTQLGRKWIKLQSLRSKMKRKIDTRCTKGRKIKFDPHPKLVNFMAPVTNNRWTDTAINELFNSVFGNKLINT